jgi:branched-subunit amino acid aminotransferase/4-amino-4-deoxychorismate lyase
VKTPDAAGNCWIDGLEEPVGRARISIRDGAFLAGMGVFETLAVRQGRSVDLDEHLARLDSGIVGLGLCAPPGTRLRSVIEEAQARAGIAACGWLKVVVTDGGRWIVTTGAMDPADEGRPASAVVLPWRRNPRDPLVGRKSLSYGANLLGRRWAEERGADEGLWLNVRGHLAEGCTSNLFVVRGRQLFTPATGEGILPGVVRARALSAARSLGMNVHETRLRPKRLDRASEGFLTSSLRGVRPLLLVDGRPVGRGTPGPWTGRIAREVARLRGVLQGRDPRLDTADPDRDV